jgi:hypothetical protein
MQSIHTNLCPKTLLVLALELDRGEGLAYGRGGRIRLELGCYPLRSRAIVLR